MGKTIWLTALILLNSTVICNDALASKQLGAPKPHKNAHLVESDYSKPIKNAILPKWSVEDRKKLSELEPIRISFDLKPKGKIESLKVVSSSGNQKLDEQAVKTIERNANLYYQPESKLFQKRSTVIVDFVNSNPWVKVSLASTVNTEKK